MPTEHSNPPMDDELLPATVDVEENPNMGDDSPDSMTVDPEGNPPMDSTGSHADSMVEISENPPM